MSLALDLFADVEFSGAINARFTVLFTALEVFVPKTSSRLVLLHIGLRTHLITNKARFGQKRHARAGKPPGT